MDNDEYLFTVSMQKLKKLPVLIIIERLFITKEYLRFCLNALIGFIFFSLPAMILIKSLHTFINDNNKKITEVTGIRFAFIYGFFALSIIIIYLCYCLLISINTIMMS